MARERTPMDDQRTDPERSRRPDMDEERIGPGAGEDVRGIADEGDEEFEEGEELEDDEEDDEEGSF